MVHVEEAKEIQQLIKPRAKLVDVLHTGGVLFDEGSKDGGQRQEDKEENAQFYRAEKVPKEVSSPCFAVPFLHFHLVSVANSSQLVEFFNILKIIVSREKELEFPDFVQGTIIFPSLQCALVCCPSPPPLTEKNLGPF